MKNFILFPCLLAVAVLSGISANGQVTAYSIFKVANYNQVSASQPGEADAPDAYYFGAQLSAETNSELITNASVTTPDSMVYPMPGNPVPTYYSYNSDYYATLADMDADYPPGNYLFAVSDTNDTGILSEPARELFTASIPYFVGDTWTRLQNVDPTRPLKLCWNDFDPADGATSAYVFVRILDSDNNFAYSTNFLEYDVTNICVPPCVLQNGQIYTIQLLFSDRDDAVNYGFDSDAAATAGFDVLTYTSLVTAGPPLCIALGPTTGTVLLSWPVTASAYELEWTTDLAANGDWQPVTCVTPSVVNCKYEAVLPACGQAKYFRLYQPPPVFAVKTRSQD